MISSHLFLSAKYAYYNTGNALTPEGGMNLQAGRSLTTGQSFGSFSESISQRPQQTVNADAHAFVKAARRDARHRVRLRLPDDRLDHADRVAGQRHPRRSRTRRPTSARRCSGRATAPTARTTSTSTSATRSRKAARRSTSACDTTISAARRCRATSPANKAFPTLVPGLTFAGYDSPFAWNNFSPRAGLTFALDESRHTIARAAYSRYAGQLSPTTIGGLNPASAAGSATYRWVDTNGDHFAQADEVLTDQRLTQGGGFNPANPTAVTSANQLDPNLKAPITDSFVAGVDRELMPHLALQVNYSYTKTTNLFGNNSGEHHAARGRDARRLHGGPGAHRDAAGRRELQRADVRGERRQGGRRRRRVPDDDGPRLLDRLPRPRGRRS